MSSFEKLEKLIIKDRLLPDWQEWYETELFFFDCNEDACDYYISVLKELKGNKAPNKNNSLIAYLMGITDEKPVTEINASPAALPDIDYDTNARDQAKSYLVYKFGRDRVTLMGTFGTLKTKGAVKDILRQMRSDMNFKEVNELTKHFDKLKRTDYGPEDEYFNAALKEVPELGNYFQQNEDIKDAVLKILGAVKSTGVHAGGIVVSGEDVTKIVPCVFERKKDMMWVTQPDMKYVEWAGLIKYDFLGLNTLNDIGSCFRLIEKRTGKVLTMAQIPKNDPTVMRMFRNGDTKSVFQFGTFLAHHLLTQLKEVRNINDLAIITSIARPGPLEMGMDKTFIRRVNGDEPLTYFHPSLEPILKDTYAVVCYQEQVMQIVKELGGLSGNESLVVLKAMGKKQLDKLLKFKGQFMKNCIAKYPEMAELVEFEDPETKEIKKVQLTEKIWLYLEAFAKYGFNKSHAIAYSTVSYICMWLKHYYKLEWIAGVLSNSSKDDFKEFYAQWHHFILKPDINKSRTEYVIEKVEEEEKTIMPFSFINGLGDKAVASIIECQPYNSFDDFFARIDKRKVNKNSIINLIYCGAFDSLKEDFALPSAEYRKNLILKYFELKAKLKKPSKKEKEEQQIIIDELKAMNRGKFLMKEVSLLNLTAFNYFEFYKDQMTRGALKAYGMEAVTPGKAKQMPNNAPVVVGGAVESIRFITIKNGKSRGKEMAKITIINEEQTIAVTVFPDQLEKDISGKNAIRDLAEFTPVIFKGKIQTSEQYGTSMLYEKGNALV